MSNALFRQLTTCAVGTRKCALASKTKTFSALVRSLGEFAERRELDMNDDRDTTSSRMMTTDHATSTASGSATDLPVIPPAKPKQRRGFAAMDPRLVAEIASKGGKAAHAAGTAHEFTSDEARSAGRKGGLAPHQRRRATPPKNPT